MTQLYVLSQSGDSAVNLEYSIMERAYFALSRLS